MNLYAVHANRGLAALQRKMGDSCPTFLWNRGNPIRFDGTDAAWLIIPGTVTTNLDLVTGGFGEDRKVRFSALIAQFYTPTATTIEQVKAQLDESPMGYLGGSYKITTIEIAPGGLVLVMEANSLNQGA